MTMDSAIAELLAAGDGLCRLIADGTAGRLDTDMAALSRWSRACQSLKDELLTPDDGYQGVPSEGEVS